MDCRFLLMIWKPCSNFTDLLQHLINIFYYFLIIIMLQIGINVLQICSFAAVEDW